MISFETRTLAEFRLDRDSALLVRLHAYRVVKNVPLHIQVAAFNDLGTDLLPLLYIVGIQAVVILRRIQHKAVAKSSRNLAGIKSRFFESNVCG